MAYNAVCERDVGILCFRNENVQLKGIIKARWSDFHVREVARDGSIAKLERFDAPAVPTAVSDESDIPSVLSPEDLLLLKELSEMKDGVTEVILETHGDKEQRTKIHKEIRREFSKLDSTTITEGNQIKVTRQQSRRQQPGAKRDNRKGVPKLNYRFVLWKEFMDTSVAIDHITRILRCNHKAFNIAGTKDKRAITAQFVSTYIEPSRLLGANKSLRNIKMGNMEIHSGEHLRLGDLKANQFKLIIRKCEVGQTGEEKRSRLDLESIVTKSAEAIRRDGFINYFGLQRFGSSSILTHTIGIEILKGNFDEAVNLLLCPRDEAKHKSYLIPVREAWKATKNASLALDKLEKKHTTEGKVLFGLKDNPNDFVGALGRLPRTLRQMYVHAVQSLVWNQLTSERLKKGNQIIIGDLVQPDPTEKLKVQHVTSENIASFTMEDVVMTMPGFDVSYPNIIKDKLDETLGALGLTSDCFSGSVKDYRLPGAYRKVIAKPKNFEAEVIQYEDSVHENILKSERDWLPELANKEDGKNVEVAGKENRETSGTNQALIVQFELPTASYATMALRELLHCDEHE